MVEFALPVAAAMLVIVLTVQGVLYVHHRSALDTAAQEGAFEASLVGHGPRDGISTTRDLWSHLDPGGGPIQVEARRSGHLMVVTASGTPPSLVPLPIKVQAEHPIEQFEPGSTP